MLLPLTAWAGQHAITLHGEPKYPADFEHFDYVNPDAPKGGQVRLHGRGTFDSLHGYILRGTTPNGVPFTSEVAPTVDSLMVSSADEPFSMYGLVAETIKVADDHLSVTFTLREEARFHDGEPIKPSDVVFSLNILKTEGHPIYQKYYADIDRVEQTGEREVTFYFRSDDNPELPLIIGQLPVLPEHYWAERDFSRTTLEPPLGSGPYRITRVEPGRSVTYERVRDYWAKDLPVNRGRYNFDTVRYDFYRDDNIALQAFIAGEYDFRQEYSAGNWANGYNTPARRAGNIVLDEIEHTIPQGVQAFFFNTRRAKFSDPRVREALNLAFDYEWANRALFHDSYTRAKSFFSNSELAARELPSEAELELLEPYRDQLPEEVFTQVYEPPVHGDRRQRRENLLKALALLEEAGWEVRDGRLTNVATGQRMQIEFLLVQSTMERVALPFIRNLERLGIEATVRTVDITQYLNRVNTFDFDITSMRFPQSMSPGNEQRSYWGSAAAETEGSRNVAGISHPVVDDLIEALIRSPDREALIARTRALDRVLLWQHYIIPHWYSSTFRIAYWNKFGRPEQSPDYSLGFNTWWVDAGKAAHLRGERD
ncbi:hypothetical protein CAI21_05375 [Alkalilimnicola ehrlichii]|uniref:Solute-binding protein family 5 domain-containing protein n=2 Tax=Alkalilimnicola ehrlichii TaxID=351052 RepID=A0A3E0X168_9GAMM|nr:hypothetical protein CAI21_05375 [Alkalilimnicola ehrlichii]RFA38036.1 hypothetical protein CAL65_06745 [Alkalilimnicola ehrlichii]